MGMENNPIDQLIIDVDTLKRTKQNNIPAGGNSMILTRGNIDGETSVLYRKDVINENRTDPLNIPSEPAVVEFVDEKLHVQNQQFKSALSKISSDAKAAVDAETTRAMVAEAELKTMVQVINVDGVKQMIVDETNRATGVEHRLREKIKDEKERASEVEASISASLDAEVNRASTKEGELQHAIGDETGRAKAAEKALSNRIDSLEINITETKNAVAAEENRAESAENAINSKLDTTIQNANTVHAQIRTDLGNEINRASTAEASVKAAIEAEVIRAKSEEHRLETLMKGINYDEEFQALKEHVSVTEGVLSKRIDDEISRANTAEAKLQTDLNSEIERASRSDERAIAEIEGLKRKLAEEIQRSYSVDEDLNSRLNAEVTRATTVEDNLYKAVAEVADKANDTDKETTKKVAELTERLNASVEALNAADAAIAGGVNAEADRAKEAERKLNSDLATEIGRAKEAEQDIHRTLVDEVERSTAEDKRLELLHQQDISKLNDADSILDVKIDAEINRATGIESALDAKIDQVDAAKVDKTVAGADGTVVKDFSFSFKDSDYCDKNAKQIEFHKVLLDIRDGKTTDYKEIYDLSIISGAHDIGLALDAEKNRAMAAEQHLHDLIDRGISDNSVGIDVYESNNYRTVSSHDFNVEPTIFGSMFWTKTVTKDVRDPSVESVKEFHFVSSDLDVDVTHVTKDASIINLRVNKATEMEVSDMLKSVFGV